MTRFILVFVFSIIISCSSTEHQRPEEDQSRDDSSSDNNSETQKTKPPIAPWEVWQGQLVDDPQLATAIKFEVEGKWKLAKEQYEKISTTAKGQLLSEDAFIRVVGIDLKLGQSRLALEEINQHLKESDRKLEDISPVLALLAAYSYLHLGNDSQFFAWCKVVLEKSKKDGIVARQTQIEATRYLSTLSKDKFNDLFYQWSVDSTLAEIFLQEKEQRKAGGDVAVIDFKKWFKPDTYKTNFGEEKFRESDLGTSEQTLIAEGSKYVVSVLLPESGKFASPARFVRQGIELAIKKSPLAEKISLNFLDTRGEQDLAAELYSSEADINNAQIILGPLLAKEAESIALKSRVKELPFITFTKKENITELSPLCFRLGFTAKDQAEEVATYLSKQLKAETVLVLSNTNSENKDFVAELKSFALKNRININEQEISSANFNAESFISSIQNIQGLSAIVFADGIGQSIDAVTAVRNSSLKEIKLIGTNSWNDPAAIRAYSLILEGAMVVSPFFLSSSRTEVVNFVADYKNEYNTTPDILTAQAYDAMKVVIAGLEQAQSLTLADVRKNILYYLSSVKNNNAVTGILTVNSKHEFDRQMSVLQIYKGGLLELMLGDQVVGFVPNDQL